MGAKLKIVRSPRGNGLLLASSDGVILPNQLSTSLLSTPGTAKFRVDFAVGPDVDLCLSETGRLPGEKETQHE